MWLLLLLLPGLARSVPDFLQFRDSRHPEPLQGVALRPCSPAPCSGGDVFVGGRDSLYHLDADLNLIGRASTGPALDSPLCPPPPAPCPHNRTLSHNENRVLLLTPDGSMLLVCGTLYQGTCRLHKADAVATSAPVGPRNDSVSSVSGLGTAIAFWGSSPQALYVAASYDGRPPQLSPASVSRRLLTLGGAEGGAFSLRYAHRADKELSGVDFAQPYKRTYKVDYVYGFVHGGHAYWVTVQPVSGESAAWETRLARVCERDPRFLSYAEVPLGCRLGGQPYLYAEARSAHLGVASAALRNRLKLGRGQGEERVLFVSFVSAVPGHGRLADARRGSVVCSFPVAAVRAAFANASAACARAEPRTRLLKHVVGADAACTPRAADDVQPVGVAEEAWPCGEGEESWGLNPFVEGRDPLQGGVRLHLEAEVTCLFTTLQNGNAVLFAGTRDGQLVKVHLDRTRQSNLFWRTIADEGAEDKRIRPAHSYDPRTGNLYLLAGDKVVRFGASSCAAYASCGRCLGAEDPLACGWCGDRCAHRDECGTPDLLGHDKCPPILQGVSPLRGPVSGGTLLTLTGDNFGRPAEGEELSRIQIHVAGLPCALHAWDTERVQCRTSPASGPMSGKVLLNVSDSTWIQGLFNMEGEALSAQDFEYVSPRLLDFSPDRGPVSGGTSLNLTGEYLDAGLLRSVQVCGVPCQILEALPDSARCMTGPRNESSAGPLEMRIDDAALRIEGRTFRYLPDPEVRDIQPRVATVGGGSNVTVYGSHLDSVAEPRMLVVVASPLSGRKMEFRTACSVCPGGTRMVCRAPRLPVGGAGLRAPTARAPLVSAAAFELDGARAPRELPLRRPLLSQLLFYPDPELLPFPPGRNGTLRVPRDRAFLTLQGRHLDLVLQPQEVSVEVGGAPCEVSAMSREELVCVLPPAADEPVPVQVRMGSRVFSPGRLEFVPAESSSPAALLWGLLAACACACLVACSVWRRRRRKPPSYMVAYSAEQPRPRTASDACGAPPRRQGSRGNDYHDLRGRILARAAQDQAQQEEQGAGGVDEETMHLLRAENILIERERLALGEVIGQGHFGCVYKGELRTVNQEEGTHVAVKTLHNSGAGCRGDVEAFLQEALMMKDFGHRNVLGLVGVCFEEAQGSPMVVIPFMRNGDLHSYIRDEQHNPTVKDLLTFGVQIASGMNYLAELKFVHRDLAARNCMLSGEGTVKVADFGLSRDIYERDYYSSDNKKTKLPVKWMAPESLEKGTYSTKTDAWSFGVVLWELMTRGVTPYPDVDNWDILAYLKSGRRMPQPSYCPDLLYEIMLRCWLEESRDRPTFAELEEGVQGVITTLQKASKHRTVGLNVTYVNYPRAEDQGPSEPPTA